MEAQPSQEQKSTLGSIWDWFIDNTWVKWVLGLLLVYWLFTGPIANYCKGHKSSTMCKALSLPLWVFAHLRTLIWGAIITASIMAFTRVAAWIYENYFKALKAEAEVTTNPERQQEIKTDMEKTVRADQEAQASKDPTGNNPYTESLEQGLEAVGVENPQTLTPQEIADAVVPDPVVKGE